MDNVYLITGTSRGIGQKLARFFCDKHLVIGLSRSDSAFSHQNYQHHKVDLTKQGKLLAALSNIIDSNPPISVLINNAAVLTSLPLSVLSPEAIEEMVLTNLLAPIYCTQKLVRQMVKNNRGRIVNITSMATTVLAPGDSVYAGTKQALETFSVVINKELATFDVRINCLAISAHETGMLEQLGKDNFNKVIQHIPHKRLASFDEIVSAVQYLTNFKNKDIGGQTIKLGGI